LGEWPGIIPGNKLGTPPFLYTTQGFGLLVDVTGALYQNFPVLGLVILTLVLISAILSIQQV